MAKRKRRTPARGAGGRFKKKAGTRSRRKRRSSGTTRKRRSSGKRRSRRRRSNPSTIGDQLRAIVGGQAKKRGSRRRKRRLGGKSGRYRPSIRVGRRASKTLKQRLRRALRSSKTLKSGALRINPRRRRRRGKRRSSASRRRRSRNPGGRRRRVSGRRRRHLGRRRNPGLMGRASGLLSYVLPTGGVMGYAGYAGGIAADRYLPDLVAQYLWSHDTNGWAGEAVGAIGTLVLAAGLRMLGQGRAANNLVKGMTASKAAKVAMYAKDRFMGPSYSSSPRPVATAQRGMGSIVSAERLVTSEAAQRLGDFVQLQGAVPRRDFRGMRGMRDYIEFANPAAGANAMAAQLSTSQPFQPGPDEGF